MPTESSGSVKVFYPAVDRARLVDQLRAALADLRRALPVRRAVLFGSWAKGRATAFSDIDLLVVYADPRREDAYKIVRRHLTRRGLEPHVYSESEAQELTSTLERMTRGGISLV